MFITVTKLISCEASTKKTIVFDVSKILNNTPSSIRQFQYNLIVSK